jgi:hypothetical protein
MSAVSAAGPVLVAGPVADAVIRAIRTANADVTVDDRGAYRRVTCRERCVLRRADLEAALGSDFALPGDLERVMPAFRGTLTIDDDEVVWSVS